MRPILLTTAVAALCAACFDPTIRPGIACGPQGECPGTTMCVAGTCQREPGGGAVDAASADACLMDPCDEPPNMADAAVAGPTFAATSYPLAATSRGVAVGDVNGDGHMDVLVGAGRDQGAALFLGSATGDLGQRRDFPAGVLVVGVAIADMDNDTRPDLVLVYSRAEGGPEIAVHLTTSTAPLEFAAPRLLSADLGSPEYIRVVDIHGDGLPDVLVHGFMDSAIRVFAGNPGDPGSLAPVALIELGMAEGGPVALGDLDRDGLVDIAYGNMSSAGWLRNLTAAPGSFGPLTIEATMAGGAVGIGHFNDDQRLDLVFAGLTGMFALLADADVPGAFGAPVIPKDGTDSLPARFAVGDLNGDDRDDLVLGNAPPRVRLQTAAAPGQFGGDIAIGPTDAMPELGDVVVAHMNDDTLLDIVVVHQLAAQVTVYLQRE